MTADRVAGRRAVAVQTGDGEVRVRRCRAGRRRRRAALRRAASRPTTCRRGPCSKMRRVPARPGDVQGRLRAGRAGAVGRGARRTRRGRCIVADSVADDGRPTARSSTRAASRADPFLLIGQMTTTDPTPLPGRDRVAVGLHPRPAARPRRRRRRRADRALGRERGGTVRRPHAGADRGVRAGLRQPGPGPAHPHPRRPGAPRRQPGRRLAERRHARRWTSSWSSGRSRAPGRSETPVSGLYLASASAHPGGSVHGACGMNAARAALFWDRSAAPADTVRDLAGLDAVRSAPVLAAGQAGLGTTGPEGRRDPAEAVQHRGEPSRACSGSPDAQAHVVDAVSRCSVSGCPATPSTAALASGAGTGSRPALFVTRNGPVELGEPRLGRCARWAVPRARGSARPPAGDVGTVRRGALRPRGGLVPQASRAGSARSVGLRPGTVQEPGTPAAGSPPRIPAPDTVLDLCEPAPVRGSSRTW